MAVGSSAQMALTPGDQLVVMDADNNGTEDFVVRRAGSGQWQVWRSNRLLASASFNAAQSLSIGGSTSAFLDTDIVLGATP